MRLVYVDWLYCDSVVASLRGNVLVRVVPRHEDPRRAQWFVHAELCHKSRVCGARLCRPPRPKYY